MHSNRYDYKYKNCSAEESRAETHNRETLTLLFRVSTAGNFLTINLTADSRFLSTRYEGLALGSPQAWKGEEKRTWGQMIPKNQRHGGSSHSGFQSLTLSKIFGFSTRKHSGFTVGPGLSRGRGGQAILTPSTFNADAGQQRFLEIIQRGLCAEVWKVSCLDKPGSAVT